MRRVDRLLLALATLSAASAAALPLVRSAHAPSGPPTPPDGWRLGSEATERYALTLDSVVAHGGRASGVLRQQGSAGPELAASAVQSIRAAAYRGQRVRLVGWLRTPDAAAVNFWLRVEGVRGDTLVALAMAHTADAPAVAGPEWRRVAHVVDVPADAQALVFGVMLRGGGAVWMDDFQLDAVDATVAPTDRLRGPSPIREAPADEARIRAGWATLPERPRNLDFERGAGGGPAR